MWWEELPPIGFELSGRGIPDCSVFIIPISYNFAAKSLSIPREALSKRGPFQRESG